MTAQAATAGAFSKCVVAQRSEGLLGDTLEFLLLSHRVLKSSCSFTLQLQPLSLQV